MPFDPDAWKIDELGDSNWKKFIDVSNEKDDTKVVSVTTKTLDISDVVADINDAVANTKKIPKTSIPVTYYGYGSGSYVGEEIDKEKRLAEVLKTRRDPPPGGWPLPQEYAVMEQGPVTVEPAGPPKYTDAEINMLLMRADQLEAEIKDTTPEWLKQANQYTIINNRRKVANHRP